MKKYGLLALRIIIAVTLIQTLRFKLTAHPDSVYIFTKVGLEPIGRIGIGIIELIAGILLLINKRAWLGAAITIGVISGAVIMHLTSLGIEINNDGGILFLTAVFILISSIVIFYTQRKSIPYINKKKEIKV